MIEMSEDLEMRIQRLERGQRDISDGQKAILAELNRYKGAIGGFMFAISAVGVFFKFCGEWFLNIIR